MYHEQKNSKVDLYLNRISETEEARINPLVSKQKGG